MTFVSLAHVPIPKSAWFRNVIERKVDSYTNPESNLEKGEERAARKQVYCYYYYYYYFPFRLIDINHNSNHIMMSRVSWARHARNQDLRLRWYDSQEPVQVQTSGSIRMDPTSLPLGSGHRNRQSRSVIAPNLNTVSRSMCTTRFNHDFAVELWRWN